MKEARLKLGTMAARLVAENNEADHAIRTELIAYLKSLAVFLGEGLQNDPQTLPNVILDESKRMSKDIVKSKHSTKETTDIALGIVKTIDKIIGWF